MERKIGSYRDLIVWQKSMCVVVDVYALTKKFPKEEMFGLTSQMRRAVVSIPSNIAEGQSRRTRKDYAQFLHVAYGSGAELETQLEIVRMLHFAEDAEVREIENVLGEVMRMLNALLHRLFS